MKFCAQSFMKSFSFYEKTSLLFLLEKMSIACEHLFVYPHSRQMHYTFLEEQNEPGQRKSIKDHH